MIIITLGPEKFIDPKDDELGRDRTGYKDTMSPQALYDANHGTWALGARANRERYALVQFQGTVVQAIEIKRVEPVAGRYAGRETSRRSVIHGDILAEGHPVYDKYVNKASPIAPQRNPVGYFDAPEDHTPCLCGCGQPTPAGKDFQTGHDQTALHDRVGQIGSVKQFIDWFDATHGYWPDVNVVFSHTDGSKPRMRHRLECKHMGPDNKPRTATAQEMTLPVCSDCKTAIA